MIIKKEFPSEFQVQFIVKFTDSFQDGLLAPPVYTRPADYNGWKVPEILLSGHAAKIAEWKHTKSLERTRKLRPDLFREREE